MSPRERAEIKSIHAFWENLAERLHLREPFGREGQLTLLRNTPAEMRHRYLEIVQSYPDQSDEKSLIRDIP